MRAQTIRQRLPEDKTTLETTSEKDKQPKTLITPEALQPSSKMASDEPLRIALSPEEFLALLTEIALPPSQDILARRRHLMHYERWQ